MIKYSLVNITPILTTFCVLVTMSSLPREKNSSGTIILFLLTTNNTFLSYSIFVGFKFSERYYICCCGKLHTFLLMLLKKLFVNSTTVVDIVAIDSYT